MAVETPPHGERRRLKHQRHCPDGTMTCGAADTLGDMNAVVEVNIAGQAVDAFPMDRDRVHEALAHGL